MTRSIELAKQIGFEWKSDNPLIFPQVWDVASARVLAKANFPLLTTSASAYAWAQGYRPGERVGLEELLVVAGRIVREVKLPLLADLLAAKCNIKLAFVVPHLWFLKKWPKALTWRGGLIRR